MSDFLPCSYGFRPKRRAHDAVAEVRHLTSHSYEWVVEGDTIPGIRERTVIMLLAECGADMSVFRTGGRGHPPKPRAYGPTPAWSPGFTPQLQPQPELNNYRLKISSQCL